MTKEYYLELAEIALDQARDSLAPGLIDYDTYTNLARALIELAHRTEKRT